MWVVYVKINENHVLKQTYNTGTVLINGAGQHARNGMIRFPSFTSCSNEIIDSRRRSSNQND